MAKISIIVPVFNVEKYIKRCLNSLVNQTLKDIEIIIVNDGSTDNSLKICEEFKQKDDRIKIYSKENEGLGLTRNYGMDRAIGEYIAFLDSDDYIDIDFYENLYKNAKKNDVDVCFAEIKQVDSNNNIKIYDKIPFEEDKVMAKKVLYNILNVKNAKYKKSFMQMCVWRSIYKLSVIKDYNIRFVSEREFISEDIIFNIDFLINANSAAFARNTYYYYCFNGKSLTNTYKEDRFNKDIILYNEVIRKLNEYNEYSKLNKYVNNFFLNYIRALIKQEAGNCSPYEYKQKIKRIKEIVNSKPVRKMVKCMQYSTIKRFIFDFFILIKCPRILYIFTKF